MLEKTNEATLNKLIETVQTADAVLIGAGAGLSTAAGFIYTGPRFERTFADFAAKYGFHDMYSGGFYPYPTRREFWAYWSRYIWINRYMGVPGTAYADLLRLVDGKDYFVLTTNVDHCFQKAGFDKKRLFYTQGDYGLLQCSEPCCQKTWDNEGYMRNMLLAQGYNIGADGSLSLPEGRQAAMEVPAALLPKCPVCGKPLTTNLRADDRFVEDEGWHEAARRYDEFVRTHRDQAVLYLEIGVGFNTPGIIKYNFWQQVYQNPRATYACLNAQDAEAPKEIAARSLCVGGDSATALAWLAELREAAR